MGERSFHGLDRVRRSERSRAPVADSEHLPRSAEQV
jgi:hypothetical protein